MSRVLLFVVSAFLFSCDNYVHPVVTYKVDQQKETRSIESRGDVVTIHFDEFKVSEPTNAQLMDKINSDVNDFLFGKVYTKGEYESLNQMADSLFIDYKKLLNDFPDIPYKYEVSRNTVVELDSIGIFSFTKSEYTYLGGAHPNSATTFSNYNTVTNKKILLSDLFVKDYETELNKEGERVFRALKSLSPNENLTEAGFWFENDKFKVNDNFLIKKEGIEFYYNPYEIAPYALGPTKLLIPYNKIKNIIKKDGPLAVFTN